MQVEYAFLADSAQAVEGKVYVIGGGIDEIKAGQFPAVHPLLSLVVKFRLEPIECDRQYALEIEFWDPDGHPMGPRVNGQFSARRHPEEPTRPGFVQLVINVMNLELPRPGDYAFHVVVNGQEIRRPPLTLYVRPSGQTPPG